MKIDFQTQVVLNEFGTRVFRNEADKDYIVARIAYRFAFDQQFLWSAEQAVEKYLNFFFGRVFRRRIPNFHLRGSAINPPQDMHAEWLDILEQFVDFPRRRIRAKTQ